MTAAYTPDFDRETEHERKTRQAAARPLLTRIPGYNEIERDPFADSTDSDTTVRTGRNDLSRF